MGEVMMRRLSVVVLNWNGRELMERFLPSVVRFTPVGMAEVVVADNGSTDGSVEMLQECFPSVRVVSLGRNFGFAGGYNRALEGVDSVYTVLLNSDVEVTEGWWRGPVEVLDADGGVVAVQPKICAYGERGRFEYAGAAGGFMDVYGYPFCRGRVFSVVEADEGQYDAQVDVLWASGACFFVRTEVFRREGGFDERFFAHQEEVDLCWRLRARGYRVVCVPSAVVFHVGGATLGVESPQKTFLNFRNSLLMLYKNLPEGDLRRVMRVRFWLDLVAAMWFLVTGHPRNAAAVCRARWCFWGLRGEYAEVRAECRRRCSVDEVPEIRRRSLLWSFYVGRKQRFSEL